MKTKDKILYEALKLFSQTGYHEVTMVQVAKSVGIKDASIYNHYKSKKEILYHIFQFQQQRLEDIFKKYISFEFILDLDLKNISDRENLNKLEVMLLNSYKAFFLDENVVLFRRLLTIEQYGNEDATKVMRKTFLEVPIEYNTKIFSFFIEHGIFIDCNPKIAAQHFYSPIYYLMYAFDHKIYNEENVMEQILEHIKQFNNIYLKRKGDNK